jgi:hypothetical protein
VLVYDHVSSGSPRTFEWNIHALHKMQKLSDTKVALAEGKAHMCVEMLASPAVTFDQNDRFTTPPQRGSMNDKVPNQWHGAFATTARTNDAEFVALMRIGSECPVAAAPTAIAKRISGGWQVAVDGKTVNLLADSVSVN